MCRCTWCTPCHRGPNSRCTGGLRLGDRGLLAPSELVARPRDGASWARARVLPEDHVIIAGLVPPFVSKRACRNLRLDVHVAVFPIHSVVLVPRPPLARLVVWCFCLGPSASWCRAPWFGHPIFRLLHLLFLLFVLLVLRLPVVTQLGSLGVPPMPLLLFQN